MMNRINNKVKQFAASNWSSNQYVKKETRIPDPLYPEIPKYKARKKREPIDFEVKYHSCPFCREVLPRLDSQEVFVWRTSRVGKCPKCGARNKSGSCPACKRDTWFKKGIYKHDRFSLNCGFVGRRLKLKSPLER